MQRLQTCGPAFSLLPTIIWLRQSNDKMLASRFLLKGAKLTAPKIRALPKPRYPYVHLNLFHLYKEINGHLRIPGSYVIGAKDNDRKWPTEFIGFKLGRHVSFLRQKIKKSRGFKSTERVQDCCSWVLLCIR